LTERLTASPGRQPLRTGAVTASSTIPLRSVPFRVICVLGVDDGSLSLGESEGDDLVDAQQFVGDPDARAEQRRVLLDAVMAAKERLIITCNGRSIKNNTPIPLVTPLAEFVDFCGRHGVENRKSRDGEDCSQIEVIHPRHAASENNFVKGGVIGDRIWSPDDSLRSLAEAIREHALEDVGTTKGLQLNGERRRIVELVDLEQAFVNPIDLFLRQTLGIQTFKEDLTPDDAILPIVSEKFKDIARSYLDCRLSEGDLFDEVRWNKMIAVSGLLPVGAFANSELVLAKTLAESFIQLAKKDFHLAGIESTNIEMQLTNGTVVRGTLQGIDLTASKPSMVFTSFDKKFDNSYWGRSDRRTLALRLLALIALDSEVKVVQCLHRHDDAKKSKIGILRKISIGAPISIEDAIQRFESLSDLYELALTVPIGSFDGAGLMLVSSREDARKRFDAFVHSDSYGSTSEFLCFGVDPDFDVVFAPGGAMENYWAGIEAVLTIEAKTYKIS
jgi:exonuclease V gamma subunit